MLTTILLSAGGPIPRKLTDQPQRGICFAATDCNRFAEKEYFYRYCIINYIMTLGGKVSSKKKKQGC
jgi:hypothetical protein